MPDGLQKGDVGMNDYEEIKKEIEKDGYQLTDAEFSCLVEYARRKAESSGKDESYLPYLILDVVKEYFFRAWVSATSVIRLEGANI